MESYFSNREVGMTKAQYYDMMDQLGKEVDPDKVPKDVTDLPITFQTYVALYSYLPDRWEGMSGSYLGKDLSSLDTFFTIFEVTDKLLALQAIKMLENIQVKAFNAKQKSKSKKK